MGGQTIGTAMMTKINEIIQRHPEWFPWEHKYWSIPNSVHEAYLKEKWKEILARPSIINGEGLSAYVNKVNQEAGVYEYDKSKSLYDIMEKRKREQEMIHEEDERKNKALWDKHYESYGLDYRKN